MRELLTYLPIVGTCGVVALLAGPLAQLTINLGAWLLEWLCRPTRAGDPRRAALHDSVNSITRWRTAPGLQPAPRLAPTAAMARAFARDDRLNDRPDWPRVRGVVSRGETGS